MFNQYCKLVRIVIDEYYRLTLELKSLVELFEKLRIVDTI
jgi:hypothetical protein